MTPVRCGDARSRSMEIHCTNVAEVLVVIQYNVLVVTSAYKRSVVV